MKWTQGQATEVIIPASPSFTVAAAGCLLDLLVGYHRHPAQEQEVNHQAEFLPSLTHLLDKLTVAVPATLLPAAR